MKVYIELYLCTFSMVAEVGAIRQRNKILTYGIEHTTHSLNSASPNHWPHNFILVGDISNQERLIIRRR